MRITSKGQVTIPQALRRQCGLVPHTQVEFRVEEGRVILNKAAQAPSRGEKPCSVSARAFWPLPSAQMNT
jgi:antitoxin PrlF